MRVDASAFARAIHFNMDAEDLSSLMMSYANGVEAHLRQQSDHVWATRMKRNPISVKIFRVTLRPRMRVLDHIDAYNKQVKAIWPR